MWRLRDFDAAYAWAKKAYLVDGKSPNEICKVTGFKYYEIQRYVHGHHENKYRIGWNQEIAKWKEYVMDKELNKARKGVGEIIEKFLGKLDEAVTNFKANNIERADELKMMASTLREFIEIERLENDKPTKIFGYEELTRHNIKEKIQNLINMGIPIGNDLTALVNGEPMPMKVDPEKMN